MAHAPKAKPICEINDRQNYLAKRCITAGKYYDFKECVTCNRMHDGTCNHVCNIIRKDEQCKKKYQSYDYVHRINHGDIMQHL